MIIIVEEIGLMSGITHFVADEYGHKVWFHVFI
jgi:hypothetical protein